MFELMVEIEKIWKIKIFESDFVEKMFYVSDKRKWNYCISRYNIYWHKLWMRFTMKKVWKHLWKAFLIFLDTLSLYCKYCIFQRYQGYRAGEYMSRPKAGHKPLPDFIIKFMSFNNNISSFKQQQQNVLDLNLRFLHNNMEHFSTTTLPLISIKISSLLYVLQFLNMFYNPTVYCMQK